MEGIRAWRAYVVGLGRFISYREVITESQGPTDLIVHENFFTLKEAGVYKRETNSENEQCNGLFSCSESGCNMVFKKFSELENHLDLGEHSQVRRNSDTCMTSSEETGRRNFVLLIRTKKLNQKHARSSWRGASRKE